MSLHKKALPRRNQTLNNEILTKTQVALDAIRQHEARKLKTILHPLAILHRIDTDYSRLHFHKQLHLDRTLRIQLFPYNEQYFLIDMATLLFPVRIFVKNVHNEGVLFVGYDRQFPGNSKSPTTAGQPEMEQSYDFKFRFNRDTMFVLKNQNKKLVSKLYLTFSARSELLMFNVKYDCIGYHGMPEDQPNRKKRSNTETKIQLAETKKESFFLPPTHAPEHNKKNFGFTVGSRMHTSFTDNSLASSDKIITSSEKNLIHRQDLQVQNSNRLSAIFEDRSSKDHLQLNLQKLKNFRRQKSSQMIQMKKEKANETVLRIKINKEQLSEAKQKEIEVKKTALKFKKLIESYEKNYKANLLRNRKVLKLMAPILFASIFADASYKLYSRYSKSMNSAFQVRYLTKKFSKAMKKQRQQSLKALPRFTDRNYVSVFHILSMECKVLHEQSLVSATDTILSTAELLKPGLVLNFALNSASKYRRAVRIIQRRWLIKYRARLQMMQEFAMEHVNAMTIEFPHLKLGLGSFLKGNHCHHLVYEYMTDESLKYRNTLQAYNKKLRDIHNFKEQNKRIRQFNQGKIERRKKQELLIPKTPLKPQHRMFRNLDILKSMLRGWFELEYKKILKKNSR